jgi:hypothetical protein
MSWSLVKYVLTAALRDRLIVSLIVVLLLGASLSVFLGSGAITEKDRFALVFAGGGLRLAGVLGLVLFVVFLIRRSFESKDVEFLLSRPVGRIEFLLSYAAAFSLLGILLGAAQGLCIYIIAPHLFAQSHVLWIVSIMMENIIMANTALFFAMILSSAATAAMATFGLYVLSRLMGQILGIIDAPRRTHLDLEWLEYIMQVISAVTPRLDLLGQTSWLMYGPGDGVGFGFVLAQGAVFTALVVIAALIDLVRRQF